MHVEKAKSKVSFWLWLSPIILTILIMIAAKWDIVTMSPLRWSLYGLGLAIYLMIILLSIPGKEKKKEDEGKSKKGGEEDPHGAHPPAASPLAKAVGWAMLILFFIGGMIALFFLLVGLIGSRKSSSTPTTPDVPQYVAASVPYDTTVVIPNDGYTVDIVKEKILTFECKVYTESGVNIQSKGYFNSIDSVNINSHDYFDAGKFTIAWFGKMQGQKTLLHYWGTKKG